MKKIAIAALFILSPTIASEFPWSDTFASDPIRVKATEAIFKYFEAHPEEEEKSISEIFSSGQFMQEVINVTISQLIPGYSINQILASNDQEKKATLTKICLDLKCALQAYLEEEGYQ